MVSRDMSDHPIILESVRLAYAQAGCDPIRMTEAFVIFRFPLMQCGTTVQVRGHPREARVSALLRGLGD